MIDAVVRPRDLGAPRSDRSLGVKSQESICRPRPALRLSCIEPHVPPRILRVRPDLNRADQRSSNMPHVPLTFADR